jgi:hypothetical protein
VHISVNEAWIALLRLDAALSALLLKFGDSIIRFGTAAIC